LSTTKSRDNFFFFAQIIQLKFKERLMEINLFLLHHSSLHTILV
jgi:hypothetical protein